MVNLYFILNAKDLPSKLLMYISDTWLCISMEVYYVDIPQLVISVKRLTLRHWIAKILLLT